MSTTLILGGARSGKSALAERLAAQIGAPVTVIVTAQPQDAEMNERIAQHRAQRPAHWKTLEAPCALAEAIEQTCTEGHVVIVDCLTLWLSNVLFGEGDDWTRLLGLDLPQLLTQERALLLQSLGSVQGTLLLVSNEVGLGVVPLGAGNRVYVDEAGRLHQALAAQCDNVIWTAAGLPLIMKGQMPL